MPKNSETVPVIKFYTMAQKRPTGFWNDNSEIPRFRHLSATPLTHPTFGCVFNAKPSENPTRCHGFQTMTLENPFYRSFTAMTAFNASGSQKSHVHLSCQCNNDS